jgi:hypothetical protein
MPTACPDHESLCLSRRRRFSLTVHAGRKQTSLRSMQHQLRSLSILSRTDEVKHSVRQHSVRILRAPHCLCRISDASVKPARSRSRMPAADASECPALPEGSTVKFRFSTAAREHSSLSRSIISMRPLNSCLRARTRIPEALYSAISSMPSPVPRFREYFFSLSLFQCSCTPRLDSLSP